MPVLPRNLRRDPRSAAAVADEPSFRLKLSVGARDGVGRDAEVAGELTHRRERHLGLQLAAFDGGANLLDDLPIRR